MDEPELTQWRNEWRDNAHYYIGLLIDTFNHLEKTIEKFIIAYFKVNKESINEFSNIILDRLTFQSKMECFNTIMCLMHEKSGFIKSKNGRWPHSDLMKKIQESKDERNSFAHYYLVIPNDPTDSIIVFTEFRDSLKFHEYSKEEYEEIIYKIGSSTAEINTIYTKLPGRFTD